MSAGEKQTFTVEVGQHLDDVYLKVNELYSPLLAKLPMASVPKDLRVSFSEESQAIDCRRIGPVPPMYSLSMLLSVGVQDHCNMGQDYYYIVQDHDDIVQNHCRMVQDYGTMVQDHCDMLPDHFDMVPQNHFNEAQDHCNMIQLQDHCDMIQQ